MHPLPASTPLDAIVALDDERRNATDRMPLPAGGWQPHAAGEAEAKVLVLREAVELIVL
jgi:hypothetical protein